MANLLLVEDDASVRQIVMLQLSLVGYDVRAAEDAGQARRMMEEKKPDLAILDIMLPGEDGFSLAETMMERAVPVLFLTAKTAVSDRVRGRAWARRTICSSRLNRKNCWRAWKTSSAAPGRRGRILSSARWLSICRPDA